jgi:thermostable 8-oxoguanine DNA glycosylase
MCSICVAGHNADSTLKAVEKFLADSGPLYPLAWVKQLDERGELIQRLKAAGIGTYHKVARCLLEAWERKLDLRTCSVEELESLYGVGPKTARFFVGFSRSDQKHAILDVHILRWMKSLGYDVPKNTPCGRRYREIEQQFLTLCEKAGVNPIEADYAIWTTSRETA